MQVPKTRFEIFTELFPLEKHFRFKQIEENLFKPEKEDFNSISNLPNHIKDAMQKEAKWYAFKDSKTFESKSKDTFKALLTLEDGHKIETVLMENARGQWTVCVSSQVGCAMGCKFCATGKMGLIRSLNADEIVDQYRFWQKFAEGRISNLVMMGMGEPMTNYENVKTALITLLKYTDLGPTHITVSTVGILPALENLLNDPTWPDVRIAISLHSAIEETRAKIVPSTVKDFIPKLKDWVARYLKEHGNRHHHITFEYVMLNGVNDTEAHAKALAKLAKDLGQVKINLIPYNFTNMDLSRSTDDRIAKFQAILEADGALATLRHNMGDDIEAACGQLLVMDTKPTDFPLSHT
ncbi:MAG: 23S rRNA (adenine(2503)-C(2))-methyltransferase RlmN [Candidatus Gracilibacteria bacterium]